MCLFVSGGTDVYDCASAALLSPDERMYAWLLCPAATTGLDCINAVVDTDELAALFVACPVLVVPIVRCSRVVWDDDIVAVRAVSALVGGFPPLQHRSARARCNEAGAAGKRGVMVAVGG